MSRGLILSVDFDGTCCTPVFPKLGADIGAAPVLKFLQSKGHKIICNTLRGNFKLDYHMNKLEVPAVHGVKEWQKRNKFKFDAINTNIEPLVWTDSPKIYADIYIDDWSLGCPRRFFGHTQAVDWMMVVEMLYDRFSIFTSEEKDMLKKQIHEECLKNYNNYVGL